MSLDTTVAGATANAYIDVTAANAYATDDVGAEATAWTASSSAPMKEACIKRATREIDAYLRSEYAPQTFGQALLFPRSSVDVSPGTTTPIIPTQIKLACYAQAIYLLRNSDVIAAAQTRTARGMSSASEPSVSFVREGDSEVEVLCLNARHYLSGFRTSARPFRSGSLRSLRVQPGFDGW